MPLLKTLPVKPRSLYTPKQVADIVNPAIDMTLTPINCEERGYELVDLSFYFHDPQAEYFDKAWDNQGFVVPKEDFEMFYSQLIEDIKHGYILGEPANPREIGGCTYGGYWPLLQSK